MTDRNFALPPLGKAATVTAWVLGAGIPAFVAIVLIVASRQGELDPLVAVAAQGLVALVMITVLVPLLRRRIAFDGRRLRVEATFYTREAPLSEFDLAAARVVDLRERDELRPAVKTNGFDLPGFRAGHVRLRDFRRRAFCLVTDAGKVLALPHADGRVWLLSFEHPQAVLDILRRAA